MRNYSAFLQSGLFKLLVMSLMAGVIILSGCPKDDDTSNMANQIQATRSQGQTKRNAAAQNSAAPQNPVPDPNANPCAVGENAEPEYTGPRVQVEDFSVKLPYPEFDGEGRYDIKCKVKLEQPVDDSSLIWQIIARNEAGDEVGSKELHIVMYDDFAKALDLNSFYCKSRPYSLEFRATEKKAVKAGGESDSGGGGRGGRGVSDASPGVT